MRRISVELRQVQLLLAHAVGRKAASEDFV
jgi:hypothetical protein